MQRRRDSSFGLTPELEREIILIRKAWKIAAALGSLLLCATSLFAGTITGRLQTATGGAVTNGTLSFRLSQPAVLVGTASLVTSPASCYISAAGNIVGVPDPLVAPVVTSNTISGTLPAGTYFVLVTYAGASGESVASPESTVVLTAQGTVIVAAPVKQPSNATGYNVYIGTTSGTETLQASVTGFIQYSQASALAGGAALPVSNSSVCSLAFSDQLIPSGTYYAVNLVNKNGSTIAGFPQTWCIYGGQSGVINVSNGAPTGNCGTNGVIYPTPIFAVPQNNAPQSISSPLSLGTNPFAAGPITGSRFDGVIYMDGVQYPCSTAGLQSALVAVWSLSGVVDARGCGTLTITSEIDLGNSTHLATLLIPSLGTWSFTITDGISCGLKMFDGSSIVGDGMSNGGVSPNNSFRIQAIPTASADSMICSDPSPTGGGSYVRIQGGLLLYNPSGGTFPKGLLHLQKLFDASSLRDVTVASNNGLGALFDSVCCGTTADKLVIDSTNGVGASGLVIDSSGGFQSIAFACRSCSVDHPGSAQHAIEIKSTSLQSGAIEFDNLYVEGNTAAQTASYIKNTASTGGVTFYGGMINPRNASETAYCFENANVSTNQLYLFGVRCAGAPATQNQITDAVNSLNIAAPSANGGVIYRYATIDPTMRSIRNTTSLSTGAATHNFSGDHGGNFQVAPICTATDQTAANPVKASASATVLTLAGTGSDAIAWRCDGNPN